MSAISQTPWPDIALEGVQVCPVVLPESFVEVAARFAAQPGTVVLLSGGGLDCARYHLLGIRPWLTLRGRSGRLQLTVDGTTFTLHEPAFTVLGKLLEAARLPAGDYPAPLAAGLMGYLAYDLKDEVERLPRTGLDHLQLPDIFMAAPSVIAIHDCRTGRSQLIAPQRRGRGGAAADLAAFERTMEMPCPPAQEYAADGAGLRSNFTQSQYEAGVRRAIEYIAAGDIYQVNLSQRFQTQFSGDPFALFQRLFELNPAPFFAFIQAGDHQILSTSPERFLLQNGRRVETRPIKGTRPRGASKAQDEALRVELARSPKEDAELSMIVDLLRNDLGKVCRPGSVQVSQHKRLEAYQNVYHLVSIVEGELEAQHGSVDLIQAAFPGGSITGCPKVRAMEIIDELEPCRRHVYCGSIGHIGFNDTMDLSIAIRTATLCGGALFYSVGGGIVFDSDPSAEYDETLQKGRTLAAACLTGKKGQEVLPDICWCNGRLQPAREAAVASSDLGLQYGFGFFETMRVDAGHAPLLSEHIARFVRTWRLLFPMDPAELDWQAVIARVIEANGLQNRCAAVKLLATRGRRERPPWDHTLLVSARPYTHRLSGRTEPGVSLATYPHCRQTPLAVHKTLNYLYYHLAARWAEARACDDALILNPDRSVSETSTANLLLVAGKQVIRPASPAVLPGVMADAACRLLAQWGYHVTERPVYREELLNAPQVLAANALMGTVPVLRIDGTPLPKSDDLWRRIDDGIIPGWQA